MSYRKFIVLLTGLSPNSRTFLALRNYKESDPKVIAEDIKTMMTKAGLV